MFWIARVKLHSYIRKNRPQNNPYEVAASAQQNYKHKNVLTWSFIGDFIKTICKNLI